VKIDAMSDIFISYSKPDHALALKLSAFLEAEGWSVWWDKSLGAADLYRDEIMKQLAAARAVITIWTENSVKSDWVRAEAGRAKAEGKLIPVKASDVAYDDIPLPFGEMHTENVGSTELIRAAIVAQLAKPKTPATPFKQITGLFKHHILTWIGIVGTAITVFANLSGVLKLADWTRELVDHWHGWTELFWNWVFSLIEVQLPRQLVPIISFTAFTVILVVGVNLYERTGGQSFNANRRFKLRSMLSAEVKQRVNLVAFAVGGFTAGPVLLAVIWVPLFLILAVIHWSFAKAVEDTVVIMYVLWAVAFPIWFAIYEGKKPVVWTVICSLLFLFMAGCLLFWLASYFLSCLA
jgi:TIR domain